MKRVSELNQDALISVSGLQHQYTDAVILSLDGWHLPARGQAVVTGASGSGKSTLLHLLAGLIVPTEGKLLVAGHDWSAMPAAERDRVRGQTTGIVLQSLNLVGSVSVIDNLHLARALAGRHRNETRCRMLLDSLDIGDLAKRRPASLSHGEQQRAAIARAVVAEPALILADEPTSALDDDNAALVIGLLRQQAAASGAGLVVTTHDRRIVGQFEHRHSLERAQ